MAGFIESVDFVNTRAADMWRCFQRAIETVAPTVIGAADRRLQRARCGNQAMSPIPADVVKNPYRAIGIAHHHKRLSKHIDRDRVARCYIIDKTDAHPRRVKYTIPFQIGPSGVCIGSVWEAARDGDF